MKTLVVYGSKYGFTEDCARELKSRIEGEVNLLSISKASKESLEEYDCIVIGTPIYMGNIFKPVKVFCDEKKEELLLNNVRFFVVGLGGPEATMKNFDETMDSELLVHSIENAYFGGAYVLEKMNFFERTIMKKLVKKQKFYVGINSDEIISFANNINGELK